MRKLTKRISLIAASAAIAGGVALGTGGTASAATPVAAHVQRSADGATADGHRWDHRVACRHNHEAGYHRDGHRARQHSNCFCDSDRHGRHGHVYRWDDENRCWKHDRTYRYDHDRSGHDRGQSDHDRRNDY